MSVSMEGDREENKKLKGEWADGDLERITKWRIITSVNQNPIS